MSRASKLYNKTNVGDATKNTQDFRLNEKHGGAVTAQTIESGGRVALALPSVLQQFPILLLFSVDGCMHGASPVTPEVPRMWEVLRVLLLCSPFGKCAISLSSLALCNSTSNQIYTPFACVRRSHVRIVHTYR